MSTSNRGPGRHEVSQLVAFGAATLYEANRSDIARNSGVRKSWPGAVLCGPGYSARCHPADNLPIHHAADRAAPGDVPVIDRCGWLAGYIGDVLATACQAHGISILRTGKHMPEIIGEPIVFAGFPVSRGGMVGET